MLTKRCLSADSARFARHVLVPPPGRLLELADRRADGRFCRFHRFDRSFCILVACRHSGRTLWVERAPTQPSLRGTITICTLNLGVIALTKQKRPPSRVRSLPLADAGGGLDVLIDGFSNPSVRIFVAWCFLVVQRLNSPSGLHFGLWAPPCTAARTTSWFHLVPRLSSSI